MHVLHISPENKKPENSDPTETPYSRKMTIFLYIYTKFSFTV